MFVHPVLRRLQPTPHLLVERGLLRTFGRVMPVGMTLCVVLAITSAVGANGDSALWSWLAAASFVVALASTAVFNVPIHLATGTRATRSETPSRCVPGRSGRP
ncbi:MAG: hypothetical protein ACR2I7_09070 [Geodermatophilaceae bacterium]